MSIKKANLHVEKIYLSVSHKIMTEYGTLINFDSLTHEENYRKDCIECWVMFSFHSYVLLTLDHCLNAAAMIRFYFPSVTPPHFTVSGKYLLPNFVSTQTDKKKSLSLLGQKDLLSQWKHLGRVMSSPGQTIATFQRNIVSATCYARLATLLRHVRCCWLKFENGQIFHATFVDVAWSCICLVRFVQQCCTKACAPVRFATAEMSQHVAHVTIGWPNARITSWSFGREFQILGKQCWAGAS